MVLSTLKIGVPSLVLFGCVPQIFLVWVSWRVASLFLPDWVFQIGDDCVFGFYQRLVLFFYEHTVDMKLVLYGDTEMVLNKKERVLYLSNHQSAVDWIVVHMLAARQGNVGQARYIMKSDLQKVPIYGFIFDQHGCVYVNRDNFKKQKMERALDYLKNPRIPLWLILFPEGTRFVPGSATATKSRTFAEEQGLTPLQHLLMPRTRGMHLTLDKLQDNIDAIYDVTVVYEGTVDETGKRIQAPNLFGYFRGTCKRIHIHTKRIDMTEVPRDAKALQKWTYNLYLEKDKMLEKYYSSGKSGNNVFPGEGVVSYRSRWTSVPPLLALAALTYPMIAYSAGRSLYWSTWLLGSLCGYCWLALRSVA